MLLNIFKKKKKKKKKKKNVFHAVHKQIIQGR